MHRQPAWAARFRLEQARVSLYRGKPADAVALLTGWTYGSLPDQIEAQRLILLSSSYALQEKTAEATRSVAAAQAICDRNRADSMPNVRADLLQARGSIAFETEHLNDAQKFFASGLEAAREAKDPFLAMRAEVNLSKVALEQEHFEDALEHSDAASALARSMGARQFLEKSLGNSGWAAYQIGDVEQARVKTEQAAEEAARIGSPIDEVQLLNNLGMCEHSLGNLDRARSFYNRALALARSLQNNERIGDLDVALASLLLESGDLNAAAAPIAEAAQLASVRGNTFDSMVASLLHAQWLAARGDPRSATKLLLAIDHDATQWPSLRSQAEHSLAQVSQQANDPDAARLWYRRAIATYLAERASLHSDDTRLPFFTTGRDLYLDYVQSLIAAHRDGEALNVLDQGRAETLREGLRMAAGKQATPAIDPRVLARRLHSTLLVYALGSQHSWLWAVDGGHLQLYTLPARAEIVSLLERHRRGILAAHDLAGEQDTTARALYDTLVAPARRMLPHGARVAVLTDEALSGLNFETLLTQDQPTHYWIEDVTLTQAASLDLLSRAASADKAADTKQLLLIGNPVYTAATLSPLPNAPEEVRDVAAHFEPAARLLLTGAQATPAAYAGAAPSQYRYIHFVAHAVANESTPLESAVILSPPAGPQVGGSAERLDARAILNRPIHAQLVTLSACQGSGVRSYAGEGLVGLSWAFLRAGASNVIGALWDVSDVSTPQLMGSLYDQLQQGEPPDAALRAAKLKMLHSRGVFRKPLYWGAFQLYSGGGATTRP